MFDLPILSMLVFIPLLGALFIFLISGDRAQTDRNAMSVGLFVSLINLCVSIYAWIDFDPRLAGYQFIEKVEWMPSIGPTYYLGVDGLSLPFILLTSFLIPLCLSVSRKTVRTRVREFVIAFLVLEAFINGMFASLDMILFYLFFEGVLIPMFLIIGVWGGPRRVYAAFKFFLYTLSGSVLMLVAMITMYVVAGTMEIPALANFNFDTSLQMWLWLAFFASFAVKIPMWPLHTWLPDAHVEAPTAGSVILAGVLLKMGGYGFLRFSLPMFPEASTFFADFVFVLSLIAIVYTSLVALAQKDMKKLIAYSSVAHMGYVTIGIFTFNEQGVQGAMMQMISHGLVSAALFLCVGVVYDRLHTREIARFGGLANRMPIYAFVFMIFTLASVGLPGTCGFVGEILVLVGAYQVQGYLTVIAGTSLILGASYALWLYRRVMLGKLEKEELKVLPDLSKTEILVFAPLVLAVIYLGVYPTAFLSNISSSTMQLTRSFKVVDATTELVKKIKLSWD